MDGLRVGGMVLASICGGGTDCFLRGVGGAVGLRATPIQVIYM